MAKNEPLKPKLRPIVRIGIFLISHSLLVSVVCCAAGVLALLLLPVLAKNTYISENALMPGSAHPMLSSQDVSEANKFVMEITNLNLKPTGTGKVGQAIQGSCGFLGYEMDVGQKEHDGIIPERPTGPRCLHNFENRPNDNGTKASSLVMVYDRKGRDFCGRQQRASS
ncbi:hypothetical protein U1Q18_012502 [Sarracenia purpurea var. burkii]